jgi:hypothetical protein
MRLALFLFFAPATALAGVDKPWVDLEPSTGDPVVAIFLMAAIAFVIFLLEKGELLSFFGALG